MAQSKATKKFEHRHLKDTLERRNGLKKTKQKQKLKLRQKARRVEENGGHEVTATGEHEKKRASAEALQALSVDEFFQGGFDVPELDDAKSKKRQRDETEEDSDEELDHEEYQRQLNALAEKDPEFHKHLQENEPELLDTHFEEDGQLDVNNSDATDEEDDDELQPERKRQRLSDDEDDENDAGKSNLRVQTVDKWTTAMQSQYSLRAAREIVTAFRSAVQSDDDDKQFKYSISDADVYHKLLTSALKNVPVVLQHHLPVQETKGKPRVPTEGSKFKSIAPLIRSHALSIIDLLDSLSDAATLRLTLSAILPLLPYLLSFRKLIHNLCKAVTSVWASPNEESARVAAFLVLRKLMTVGDAGIREAILKSAYQALVQSSRNTTVHTMAGINIMKNSAAELWGIDPAVGYTTGFSFIRQLAIHLRNSITNKTKESYKTIYNWQYTHSLDFWSRVLAMHCGPEDSPLRPLIYPLVQVTLGALRLIPTATYFPLRFQLTRALLRISAATGTYIPLGASLYEVLNSAEMRKRAKDSTVKPLDFATSIRAPSSHLRTRVYQDGIGEQVQELFTEFYGLWSKSIAFPELALAVIVMLKRWLKDVNDRSNGNKNAKVNGLITLFVQKLEANTKFIEERRAKVDFAPNNRKAVDAFLHDLDADKTPMGAFLKGLRRQKDEKAKMVEDSRLQEEQKHARDSRKSTGAGADEESDAESD